MPRASRDSIEYSYVAQVVQAVAELSGRPPGWGRSLTVRDEYASEFAKEAADDITVSTRDAAAITKARGMIGVDGFSDWERRYAARDLGNATFDIARQAAVLADGPAAGVDADMQLAVADMWVQNNKGPLMDKIAGSEQLPDMWSAEDIQWHWRAEKTLAVLDNVAAHQQERLDGPDRFSLETANRLRGEVAERLLQAPPEQRFDEITRIVLEGHEGGGRVPQARVSELANEFRDDLGRSLIEEVDRSPTMMLEDLHDRARDAASGFRSEAREGVPMHVLDGQASRVDDAGLNAQAPSEATPAAPEVAWKPPTGRTVRGRGD